MALQCRTSLLLDFSSFHLKVPLPFFGCLRNLWLNYIHQVSFHFKLETPNSTLGYAVIAFHVLFGFLMATFILVLHNSSRFPLLRLFIVLIMIAILLHWYLLGGICLLTPIECLLIEGDIHKDVSIAGRIAPLFRVHQDTAHAFVVVLVLFCIWGLLHPSKHL
jgi:hypothetical protein